MKIIGFSTLLLLVLCSCASLPGGFNTAQSFSPARNLARANELLASGDKAGAVSELTTVTSVKGIAGITDEALFRLALLTIHPAAEGNGNPQALNLLKRLKKEYPASRWTVQSGQLLDLLAGAEELRRQVKSLKSQNQTLVSEVNELNRNIEQLKQLDQELEKRRR